MNNTYIFQKNSSIDQNKWDELLRNSPYTTPFQTPQFYTFCNSTPGHRGWVCAVEGNDQKYHALCVADLIRERGARSYFSRRAIIYGGPLLSDENQAVFL